MDESALKTEYFLLKKSRRDILQNCKTVLMCFSSYARLGSTLRAYSKLYQLYCLFADGSKLRPIIRDQLLGQAITCKQSV